MVLPKEDCLRLQAHFGPAYLSKALYDIAAKREQSIVFTLIEARERKTKKKKQKKKKKKPYRKDRPPPIPSPSPPPEEPDEGFLQMTWKSLVKTLTSAFARIGSFLTEKLSWRTIVDAGVIPTDFDAIYKSVASLVSLTGAAFVRGFSQLGAELKRIWDYVRSIFSKDTSKMDADDLATLDAMESETVEFSSHILNMGSYVLSYFENVARKIMTAFGGLLEKIRVVVHATIGVAMTGFAALCESTVTTSERVRRFVFEMFCHCLDMQNIAGASTFFDRFKSGIGAIVSTFTGKEDLSTTTIYRDGFDPKASTQWMVGCAKWLAATIPNFVMSASAWVLNFLPALEGMFASLCGEQLYTVFHSKKKKATEVAPSMEANVALMRTLVTEHADKLSSETQTRINETIECVRIVEEESDFGASGGGASITDRVELLMQCHRGTDIDDRLSLRVIRGQLGGMNPMALMYVRFGLEQLVVSELIVALDEVTANAFEPIGVNTTTVSALDAEYKELLEKREKAEEMADRRYDAEVKQANALAQARLVSVRDDLVAMWQQKKEEAYLDARKRGLPFNGSQWNLDHNLEFMQSVTQKKMELLDWESKHIEEVKANLYADVGQLDKDIQRVTSARLKGSVKLHLVTATLFAVAVGALVYWKWDYFYAVYNDVIFGIVPAGAATDQPVPNFTYAGFGGFGGIWRATKQVTGNAWASFRNWRNADLLANEKNVKFLLENAASGNTENVILAGSSVAMRLGLYGTPAVFALNGMFAIVFAGVSIAAGEKWQYAVSYFAAIPKLATYLTFSLMKAFIFQLYTKMFVQQTRQRALFGVVDKMAPAVLGALRIPAVTPFLQSGMSAYENGVNQYQRSMVEYADTTLQRLVAPTALPPPPPAPMPMVLRKREVREIAPFVRETILQVVEKEEEHPMVSVKKDTKRSGKRGAPKAKGTFKGRASDIKFTFD